MDIIHRVPVSFVAIDTSRAVKQSQTSTDSQGLSFLVIQKHDQNPIAMVLDGSVEYPGILHG